MIQVIAGWTTVIAMVLVIVALVSSARMNRRTYKLMCDRIDAYAEEVEGVRLGLDELASLKYRMDVVEGKHLLRAKDLGIGRLPQPRPKENNGD